LNDASDKNILSTSFFYQVLETSEKMSKYSVLAGYNFCNLYQ